MRHTSLTRQLTALAKRIHPGMVSLSVCDAVVLHRAAGLCAKPGATFLEFAAGWGFSTLCILDAISQTETRFITSEVAGDCWVALRDLLRDTKAELWEGDLRKQEEALKGLALDFLFIDSNHEPAMVSWSLRTLFPLGKPGGLIAVHDVLDPTCEVYQQERAEVEGVMSRHGLQAVELLNPEEKQELQGMLPWPRSYCGVRRDLNTMVMRRGV